MRHQNAQKALVQLARPRPLPIAVKGLMEVAQRPGVHQDVTRPCVKATDRGGRIAWEEADIGDATDIGDDPVDSRLPENPVVESRNQWGTLTARGNITSPEVRNRADIRQLRDRVRVANLPAEPVFPLAGRAVANGLPMAANGAYFQGRDTSLLQQLKRRFGQKHAKLPVEFPDFLQADQMRLSKREQPVSEVARY